MYTLIFIPIVIYFVGAAEVSHIILILNYQMNFFFLKLKANEFQSACVNAEQIIDECMIQKEQNLTRADVEKFREGNFLKVHEHHHKCFTKCFLEKVNFMKDGIQQIEYISEKIRFFIKNEEAANKVLDVCKSLKLGNDCESSYELYKCYFNQNKKINKEKEK